MTLSAAEPILVAEHIDKTFADARVGHGVLALQDVSLSVRRHEFLSIIGPSGCGKSTLLRIIAGLDRPTSGSISVNGKQVKGPGADRGMVFQEYALLPWRTTLENVVFGLQLKGVPREQREDSGRRFIDLFGLAGFEHKYPHQLSGGMRQRAAVARALANQPAVLLMDEPFAALDAFTRQRLQEELTQISRIERMTVIFVTHAVEEAIFLSDRVAVLSGRPGRLTHDIEIDLPRPRQWNEMLKDARFTALRDQLLSTLHGPAAVA